MRTRRTQPVLLTRACPFCGGLSHAQAKLPVPASVAPVVFDLDDLATLVEEESLSLLLALVELLPYKNFTCRRCRADFRLESQSAKDLVQALLVSMQPVLPPPPVHAVARARTRSQPRPRPAPVASPHPPEAVPRDEWEVESLDALLGTADEEKGAP